MRQGKIRDRLHQQHRHLQLQLLHQNLNKIQTQTHPKQFIYLKQVQNITVNQIVAT